MEIYTLPCVKWIASGDLLCDSGSSNWCSVTTLWGGVVGKVGGKFKMEWTYVYLWLIHADVWQRPTEYGKVIILQLKINTLKKSVSF